MLLCLNAGSSSIKFSLYRVGAAAALEAHGQVEGIGAHPHFLAKAGDGATLAERRWPEGAALGHDGALRMLMDWIAAELADGALLAVGHRVVHGGTRFHAPALVTPALLDELAALSPLAPLHQPHNLAAIHACQAIRPGLPQVACFDTAFHRRQPDVATRFALPRALTQAGVRRYGFHGLSYDFVSRQLRALDPVLASGRVIIAHLGNGASLCAVRDGCSLDTTMGFTALDGLMMGTRCGSLDPGVVLYLLREKGMDPAAIEHLLYHECGLLGVSGLSSDMRELQASDAPEAREAIDLYVYRIARDIGALTSALEGLDGLVFTAGIGENAPSIRAAVCARLGWLGVRLDPAANAVGAPVISAPDSGVAVRVIPTDEERMIAEQTLAIVSKQQGEPA